MPQRLEAFRAIRMYPASPNRTPQLREKTHREYQSLFLRGGGATVLEFTEAFGLEKSLGITNVPRLPRPPRNRVPKCHMHRDLGSSKHGIMELRIGLGWSGP